MDRWDRTSPQRHHGGDADAACNVERRGMRNRRGIHFVKPDISGGRAPGGISRRRSERTSLGMFERFFFFRLIGVRKLGYET